jgi:GrpB-like predicted nucleotidyltransferase (UPF0157 family)
VDTELEARLRAAGVQRVGAVDPAAAWQRLHAAEGQRATLLDRYALEATARGMAVADLDSATRADLAREVVGTHFPGFEIVEGSDRSVTDPIDVVPYDPTWPARFAAWREVLADVLGSTAVGIEHIGSTSVPGLAAKPVIDIHVAVPDVEDEPSYVPAIERAGVALRSRDDGHRYFRPAGERPREVQVHVSSDGSDWIARHVLFRDFLRADAATRDAYGALKVRLAAEFRDDRIAYNEAKSAFILDALDRARAWQARRDVGAT